MDALISIVLRDSSFQTPQYIERVPPMSESDSGFRIYLGCERMSRPDMVLLGGVEDYLKDVCLYDLVFDIDVGYRIDMRGGIKDYPHIHYGKYTFKFLPSGLMALSDQQKEIKGMVTNGDITMIPFKDMSLAERKSLEWSDRKLFLELHSLKEVRW